jgi:hypothetical protein
LIFFTAAITIRATAEDAQVYVEGNTLQFLALALIIIFPVLFSPPAEASPKVISSTPEVMLLAQATSAVPDFFDAVVYEGVGFDEFTFGNTRCTKAFIISKLGKPDRETTDQWITYIRQYGLHFWMPTPDGPLREIRLERRFQGRLSSNVTLSTPMADVFSVYGAPVDERSIDSFQSPSDTDRTLYRVGNKSKIRYRDYGLLFWFEGDAITQIVLSEVEGPRKEPLRQLALPAGQPLGVALDSSTVVVKEGLGFGEFLLGDARCTKEFIKAKLGRPSSEGNQWVSYTPRFGIDFYIYRLGGPLKEIRLNRGFQGRLSSNVSLSSSMEDVFSVYGAPVAEETVDSFEGRSSNRKLYRVGNRSRIFYNEYGLLFWFEGDGIRQIVVSESYGPTPPLLRTLPLLISKAPGVKTAATDFPQKYPRWGPVGYIDRLWSYVKDSWILLFLLAATLAIVLYPIPARIRKLYYRWRPLPEGRLLISRDPSKQLEGNINIWYEARRLKKRKLLIGSVESADIRLVHKSIMPAHAFIGARRFEGGVLTYIEPLGEAKVAVNEEQKSIMPMAKNARIKIGKFIFQYEQPSEYRQVQVRYKNGKVLEGVPTSWDIGSNGFIMLPSRARSWIDAKFISFNRVKGVYFMRDWDEDVRKKLLKGARDVFKHPATIHFIDGETAPGYLIGDYSISSQRFYFVPQDQEGNVVYILVERSSTQSILEGEIHERTAMMPD